MKKLSLFLSLIALTIFISCNDDEPAASEEVEADFSATATDIFTGEAVTFSDQSTGNPTMWEWTFEGGSTATSAEQNPTVVFNSVEDVTVTLTASNADRSATNEKIDFLRVRTEPAAYFPLNGMAIEQLNGTISGTLSGTSPVFDRDNQTGGAIQFDGIDDHVNFGDVLDFDTRDFTISLWTNVGEFKGPLAGTGSAGAWMIAKGITIAGTPRRAGYALKAQNIEGENYFMFLVGGQNEVIYTIRNTGGYETDRWYHIVGRKTDGKMELFVNGALVAESTIPEGLNVDTTIPLSLGRIDKLGFDPDGTTYFDGAVDDVKIYDSALSDDEIMKLSME